MSARRQARAAALAPHLPEQPANAWTPDLDPKGITSTRIRTPLFTGRAWFKGTPTPYMLRDTTGRFWRAAEAAKLWARILPHLSA